MIYIFKGCLLPCKGCEKACDGCNGCCAPICQAPLAGFVIGTWAAMILVVVCSVHTITNIKDHKFDVLPDGEPAVAKAVCDNWMVFTYVLISFGVVHSISAFYLQRRVVCAFDDAQDEMEQMPAIMQQGMVQQGRRPPSQWTSAEITKHTGHVMLYDCGFLFYVLFCFGSFGYQCHQMKELTDCPGAGSEWAAATLLIVYNICSFMYASCFVGCHGCCAGIEGVQGKKGKRALKKPASQPQRLEEAQPLVADYITQGPMRNSNSFVGAPMTLVQPPMTYAAPQQYQHVPTVVHPAMTYSPQYEGYSPQYNQHVPSYSPQTMQVPVYAPQHNGFSQ